MNNTYKKWQKILFHSELYSIREIKDKTLVLKSIKPHERDIEVCNDSVYIEIIT